MKVAMTCESCGEMLLVTAPDAVALWDELNQAAEAHECAAEGDHSDGHE